MIEIKDYKEFKTKFGLTLNPQQEAALLRTKGQSLLLAVPGSGKTTVIICRIAFLVLVENVPPENILALTFSRMGARDLAERFEKSFGKETNTRVQFSTIHSFSLGVIRYYERACRRKAFKVLSNQTSVVRDLYRDCFKGYPGEIELGEIVQRIGYCKNMLLTENEINLLPKMEIDFQRIFKAYEIYKQENQLMDFDDILKYAWGLLKRHKEILGFFRKKYEYIHLDEAQDTSKIQFKILELLAGKKGNIFMVGDEDQSIYGFRGAFPQSLLTFQEIWAKGEVLLMEKNYRSTQEIVGKANAFIKLNKQERYAKEMNTENPQGVPIAREWVKSNEEQYQFILQSLRKEGKETAVLYRNNESAIPLVDLFEREGIAYQIKEHNPLFFSHFILKDIELFYDLSNNLNDYEIFEQISYKMDLALSRDTILRLRKTLRLNESVFDGLIKLIADKPWGIKRVKALKKGFENLKNIAPIQGINCILGDLGYRSYLDFRISSGQSEESIEQKIEVLKTLGGRVKTFQELFDHLKSLEIRLRETEIHTGEKHKVTLSTLHSSKGLEFEKVFMIDVTEGQLPNGTSMVLGNEGLYSEEVRLFYVGATRAKKELVFLCVRSGKPSHFINYLMEGLPKKKNHENLQKRTSKKESFGKKQSFVEKIFKNNRKVVNFDFRNYQNGDTLIHQRFGLGKIESMHGEIAEIYFEKGGLKKMNLSICIENGVLEKI
ncbi:MAG: ATP-dependent helicase [Eubacteriaceae bacterium]